jgi:hypothetical protein
MVGGESKQVVERRETKVRAILFCVDKYKPLAKLMFHLTPVKLFRNLTYAFDAREDEVEVVHVNANDFRC